MDFLHLYYTTVGDRFLYFCSDNSFFLEPFCLYTTSFFVFCSRHYNDGEKEGVAMKENLLIDKSIAFASRIIKLHQYLIKTKKETIISKQIVRSGTSIGASINEANYG